MTAPNGPPGSGVDGPAKAFGMRLKAGGARWQAKSVRTKAALMNVWKIRQWEADRAIAA